MAVARAVPRAIRAVASWTTVAVFSVGVALPWSAAEAVEFRRFRAEQIRARVSGRDITDGFHWTEHHRRDGVLMSTDMARRRTGRWKTERNMLCQARPPGAGFDCFQVWVSGDEVGLRIREADRTPPALIRRHEGN